jgi:biopolymer transport protein ExbD
MADVASSGHIKKARIEIIPLIDVIFFLLATFVLFVVALNKSNGLPVKLPQTLTGEARDPANSVTLTVTQEGTIAWDKEPITLDEFIIRIKQFYAQNPLNPKVLINGDTNASFSQAIYVFDEVRKAGITKVYIETLTAKK